MNAQNAVAKLKNQFDKDLEFVLSYGLLDCLLKDRTTGRNIIWATGESEKEEIHKADVKKYIRPRWVKDEESRKQRMKDSAEVFTPSSICKTMVNILEQEGFEKDPLTSTCLEITCGEAPFIASRYDIETGKAIEVKDRFGLLDRKLECAGRIGETSEQYRKISLSALKAVYGYEFQGDNLFIARLNVLMDFAEHWAEEQGGEVPALSVLNEAAEVVSWNFWQMDGLSKDCLPPLKACKEIKPVAKSIFAGYDEQSETRGDVSSPCRIKFWNDGPNGREVEFRELLMKEGSSKKISEEKRKSIHHSALGSGSPLF